jgi:hypothetical protein
MCFREWGIFSFQASKASGDALATRRARSHPSIKPPHQIWMYSRKRDTSAAFIRRINASMNWFPIISSCPRLSSALINLCIYELVICLIDANYLHDSETPVVLMHMVVNIEYHIIIEVCSSNAVSIPELRSMHDYNPVFRLVSIFKLYMRGYRPHCIDTVVPHCLASMLP